MLECITNIATIIGAMGTVLFGVVTAVLAFRSNRLQDIVSATSNFPINAFSDCCLLPIQINLPVRADEVQSFVSSYIDDIDEWMNSDYIAVFYSDTWPLHVGITRIDSFSISVNGETVRFVPGSFALRDYDNQKMLLISLCFQKIKRSKLKEFFRSLSDENSKLSIMKRFLRKNQHLLKYSSKLNSELDQESAARTYLVKFLMQPWSPQKCYKNSTLRMCFQFDNLFLNRRSTSSVELVMELQSQEEIDESNACGVPKLSVLSRQLNREKK